MKKIIIASLLILFAITAPAQTDLNWGLTQVQSSFDLSTISGADTTFWVQVPYHPRGHGFVWSTDIRWTSVTGSGTVALMVSNDTTNWYAHNSSPSATVSGASGDYQFEDDFFAWYYLGWKITKSSISAGTLHIDMFVRKD